MGVDDRSINSSSLLLYWTLQKLSKDVKLEYLPTISLSGSTDQVWTNHTNWIEKSEHRFTNLKPYTNYNMTVYVRVKKADKSDKKSGSNAVEVAPIRFVNATTAEGVPDSPRNIVVLQQNGSNILVTWERPKNVNGQLKGYILFMSPPTPPRQVRFLNFLQF